MSDRPWHKRYHSDALAGFMGLTLEERGAYQTLLDLMYDRREALVDDSEDRMRLIAGYLGVGLRKYRTVVNSLIQKGKLHRLSDGRLSNKRFEKETKLDRKTSEKRAKFGKKGGEKSAENRKKNNENNDTRQQELEACSSYNQRPEVRSQKLENKTTTSSTSAKSEAAAAVQDLQKIGDRCLEAIGISPKDPTWKGNYGLIASWLGNGWDVDLDIIPTIRRLMAQRNERKQGFPRSLGYFTNAIEETHRTRDTAKRPAQGSSNVVPIGEQVTLKNGREVPRANAIVHLKFWWFEQLGKRRKACYTGMPAWGAYDPPGHPESVWPDDLIEEAKKAAQAEISNPNATAG